MGKNKLKLDDLNVESFETRPVGALERGTVRANEITGYSDCDCGSSPFYSQCCTADPNDLQCYNSFDFCAHTQRQICPLTGDC
ncbi:pinensin family lanthipeptide [Longimicrobium terrae]|uniref:Uncharacterized protein n=1 Tax=Longimicrobium terrae TaxID=1639882 RepID=A0A841GL88_9BACT|nr:pinensin family lanthipeptide [Longimicrobium terrae]MBB4635117.1 hypothetical protein [Longimicrobium terrae]MBB6069511.1 hypothetical protein [Longimicrobium terrae]NNC31687.1 hypothetical protein [Longimicrobium terrae]